MKQKKRIEMVLQDDFCEMIENLDLTSDQKFEILYYIIYETEGNPISELMAMTEENYPINNIGESLSVYMKKLAVNLLIMGYTLNSDNKNIKRLLAL